MTTPADGKRKTCQYRVLDPCTVHIPFLVTSSLARIKRDSAHHCESEMYVCDLCNQSFSTQGSLKRHQESIHRQSAGFSCQACSPRFYKKDVLQRHLKTHQPAVLFSHSVACPTDATVDLPPPPSPPPKRHRETPVCNICTRSRSTLASWTRRDRG